MNSRFALFVALSSPLLELSVAWASGGGRRVVVIVAAAVLISPNAPVKSEGIERLHSLRCHLLFVSSSMTNPRTEVVTVGI
jgi:hypothetical protein